MPTNYVDHPVILPKGMNKHSMQWELKERKDEDYFIDGVWGVLSFIIPSRGISKSFEMPAFPIMPLLYTYSLSENDFYKIGRIKYNKNYYTITAGLISIESDSRDGLSFGWGLNIRNIYVDNGIFRYTSTIPMELHHGENWHSENIGFSHTIMQKIFSKTSASISLRGKAVYNGWKNNERFHLTYLKYGVDFGIQQHLTKALSVGWDYNLSLFEDLEVFSNSGNIRLREDPIQNFGLIFNLYW